MCVYVPTVPCVPLPRDHCKLCQANFVLEGHKIWGGLVIGLTFLPMAVVLAALAVKELKDMSFSWSKVILALVGSPLRLALYLLAVVIATPCKNGMKI